MDSMITKENKKKKNENINYTTKTFYGLCMALTLVAKNEYILKELALQSNEHTLKTETSRCATFSGKD